MINIAIFASGAGTNAREIIRYFNNEDSEKLAKVVLVACNRKDAGVLQVAEENHIRSILIEKERFFSGDACLDELKKMNIGLIVLAGFLWKIPDSIINAFRGRIINIHPALLPKYGGKGMYGHNVHQAVIDNKETRTGITIHYVDEHYDNGDIILQVSCPVLPGDSPDTLAERVHHLEHAHYPATIERLVKTLPAL